MLILSRKPGDAIIIGGNIRVVVLANDGGGVRLGIDAPSSIAIVREEILKDITDQNVRAGATPENIPFLDGLDPDKKGGPGKQAKREVPTKGGLPAKGGVPESDELADSGDEPA